VEFATLSFPSPEEKITLPVFRLPRFFLDTVSVNIDFSFERD